MDKSLIELIPGELGADYTELLRPNTSAPLSPLFALGRCPSEICRFYHSQQVTLSVGCYWLKDVDVTSHSLILKGGSLISCPQLNMTASAFNEVRLYGPLLTDAEASRKVTGPVVLLAGPGYLIYGHWLIDFLPKLYVLHVMGFEVSRLNYLLPSDTPPFALNWLSLFGISTDNIIWFRPYEEVVSVAEILAPTLLRTGSRASVLLDNAAEFLCARIRAVHPRREKGYSVARIFLSRSESRRFGRVMTNRRDIEQLANQAGFRVICPEKLSLLDQFWLFQEARQIIGEYGSALHGSIFSLPGTLVCALRGNAYHPAFLQSGLCQTRRQHIAYVFGNVPIDAIEQNFLIEIDDFQLALRLLELCRTPDQVEPILYRREHPNLT